MSLPKKGMIAEFKDFIATGDLMTIAVAFIMGAAIKAVIDSFVKDIVMGIIGLFAKCKDILDATGKATGEKNCAGGLTGKAYKSIAYGSFINQILQFVIIGFVVFMMIKAYKKMTNRTLVAAGPTPDQTLLGEIRDLLKK
jgi:large conductance mechanosensitive channel